MDPSEIDWEREERGMAVLEAGIELFGDERYGGAWFDQTGILPILHVSAVDPSQDEIDVLERAAHERRWHLTVTPVRYSYQELVNFTELVQDIPSSDSMFGFGPSARDNAIEFTLRRLDHAVVDDILGRLPHDAVKFVIRPGMRSVAIDAPTAD
jgi:hypothetical protein